MVKMKESESCGVVIVLCGTWQHGHTITDIERLTTDGVLACVGCEWTPYGSTPLAQRMAETGERAREKHKKTGPCQLVTLSDTRWLMVDAIA